MKKNIAIVITRLELGGAQKVALFIAENLDRKRYNVHLITGIGGILDDYAREIQDINLVFLASLKHPIRPFSDIRAILALKKYFKSNKIDIVHTHSSKAGIIGRFAARLAGVPSIIHTIHGFSFHEYQNPVLHRMTLFLEKLGAKLTKKLIAVGRDVVSYGLEKKIGSKEQYVVIRASVDINRFRNADVNKSEYLQKFGLSPNVCTVGMVGNLKKQKNPVAFLEIANQLLSMDKNVQFIFAGNGPLKNRVENLIKKYGIEKNVKFLGWVDEPEKFIKSLDVFLLTSLWEGLPCTLAQAIVAGKPCVATNINGNREILKDLNTGFLYDPFDYKEAAEIILQIKNMEGKIKECPENVKGIMDEFSLENMLASHEALYDNIEK